MTFLALRIFDKGPGKYHAGLVDPGDGLTGDRWYLPCSLLETMTIATASIELRKRNIAVAIVAVLLSASPDAIAGQLPTAPRLREGSLPAQIPNALGGGEVVLELTVDPGGGVTRVDRLRATPPYTDLVADAAAAWKFEPATVMIEGRLSTVAASVLVVAVFRPPSLYAGPAPGVPPQELGAPSLRLPRPASVVMPAYPPMARGDGIVLVEIEMSGRAERRGNRVVGRGSGFDAAALDAVRAWRFDAPRNPEGGDRLFVYGVLGFRTPVGTLTPSPQ